MSLEENNCCLQGFKYENNECVELEIDNCIEEDEEKCIKCADGYFVNEINECC